jgi:hypothetical protein
MQMEINAHGFILRSTLRADIERQIGRLVQARPSSIKSVAVDLFEERNQTLRGANKLCRVHVEFLNDVCETASDGEREFRAAVSEAFRKLLGRLPN